MGRIGIIALLIIVVSVAVAIGFVRFVLPDMEPIHSHMVGSSTMFEGGIAVQAPYSSDALAIVALTPAEHRDAEKLLRLLRAGDVVSLRIREEPDQPEILISDATKDGEVIIRCKTVSEANQIISRLLTVHVQQ
jgi:hypothetical protein